MRQARTQVSKLPINEANKQASKKTSKQISKQISKQLSKQVGKKRSGQQLASSYLCLAQLSPSLFFYFMLFWFLQECYLKISILTGISFFMKIWLFLEPDKLLKISVPVLPEPNQPQHILAPVEISGLIYKKSSSAFFKVLCRHTLPPEPKFSSCYIHRSLVKHSQNSDQI